MADETLFGGKELKEVSDRMERVFENLLQQPLMMISESGWRPAFDVYETQDNLVILGELAGVKKEDISIILDKELLTISGSRFDQNPQKKERLHRMEIDFGRFKRQIRINIPIHEDKIQAAFRDGFLEIKIEKAVRNDYREIPIEEQ